MQSEVTLDCPTCRTENRVRVEETGTETDIITCAKCGGAIATVGQVHARIAQQAIGLGATDLRDDHVPVDGELGERPNI